MSHDHAGPPSASREEGEELLGDVTRWAALGRRSTEGAEGPPAPQSSRSRARMAVRMRGGSGTAAAGSAGQARREEDGGGGGAPSRSVGLPAMAGGYEYVSAEQLAGFDKYKVRVRRSGASWETARGSRAAEEEAAEGVPGSNPGAARRGGREHVRSPPAAFPGTRGCGSRRPALPGDGGGSRRGRPKLALVPTGSQRPEFPCCSRPSAFSRRKGRLRTVGHPVGRTAMMEEEEEGLPLPWPPAGLLSVSC